MYTAKASLLLVALVAGVALVQAAGGIKGNGRIASGQVQRGQDGYKGPQRPLAPLLPAPAPLPAPKFQPQPIPQQPAYVPQQPAFVPQQPAFVPQQEFRQAPVKGPTQNLAPTFNVRRPEPIAQVQQQLQQQEPEPQQQQQEEIDPNAAAQEGSGSALVLPAAGPGAASAASEEEANPRPEPYNFNYSFEAGDSATSGSSIREEQQDASGKITGFYTLKGEDGRDRRVDYIADASGFHATVSTNEMGTAPADTADVEWKAQAPSDGQLRVAESATQLARQRALSNPQSLASPSGTSTSFASSGSQSTNKISSPRQNAQSSAGSSFSSASNRVASQQPQREIIPLQDSFEQIRQTELSARSRKSRHAPFYLFTV